MNLREMLDKVNRQGIDRQDVGREAGKSRGVTFRTGMHLDRKRDKRHLRRAEKAALRDF